MHRRRPRIIVVAAFALPVGRAASSRGAIRDDGPPPSYDEPVPGPGGWVQMDVVDASSLSASDFAARYVETGTPVVLRDRRHSLAGVGTPDWLRGECDLEGTMDNYGQIPGSPSTEWGGFFDPSDGDSSSSGDDSGDDSSDDGGQRVSLGEYLDYLPHAHDLARTEKYGGRLHYGFDYDAKCSCPTLLDAVPWYVYFRDDYMLSDPEFGSPGVWPSLIVGPAGSSSALHIDNSLLPFHLTLLSGRKTFRTVRLADWRARLTDDEAEWGSLYTEGGFAAVPGIDGLDDGYVEEEFIRKRGCHVFNATLIPGDTVYVPTGALHGALNLGDAPAVAITSNVFTPSHAGQLFDENCVKGGRFSFGHDGFCRKLAKDKMRREGVFRDGDEGDEGGVTYDFWKYALGRPGFCEKYRDEADCARLADRCEEKYRDQGESSGTWIDQEL